MVKCPRCRSQCTSGELRSAVYEQSREIVLTHGSDGQAVYVPMIAAEKLGIVGERRWTRTEVAGEKHTRMVAIDTDGGTAYLPKHVAEALGLSGREYWRTDSDGVCGACIEELRRGKRAHRSYSNKREGWRSL